MTMRALLCSGQGLISRHMFDKVAGDDAAEAVLASATRLLGQDPRSLLATGDRSAITQDRTSQIMCTARSLSVAAALHLQTPAMVAGYSVGEVAAWSIAGYWTPDQALRLTAHRAELMDDADAGTGGLGFIRGLDRPVLDVLLTRHGCSLAIHNPRKLAIIGGPRADVADCCASALRYGAEAALPLDVMVASHTPRLAAVVAPFAQSLSAEPVGPGDDRIMLIGAATATVIRAADRAATSGLAHQLASTVDWDAVLNALVERGARRMLELGPGNALAHMVRGAWPDVDARSIDEFNTLAGARQWFEAV